MSMSQRARRRWIVAGAVAGVLALAAWGLVAGVREIRYQAARMDTA